MLKARQLYQAIIRPALGYGAPLWHQPAKRHKASGVAAKLQKHQN